MLKLIFLFALFVCGTACAQSDNIHVPCTHCTSLSEALEFPEGVTHLNLKAMGLGEIPKEINLFRNLQSLNLSDNFIQEINFDTLSLPGLKELNLSKNPGFNTMELDGLSKCSPNLTKIDFSYTNSLSVSAELARCEALISLDLSNNWIHYLPNKLGNLDHLQALNLSNNKFKMMPFLDDLWGLQVLDISENKELNLSEIAASLLLKESLETLILSPQKDNPKGFPNVFEELQVETLVLKNCSVGGLNNALSRNKTLNTIVLDNARVVNPKRFAGWLNRMENVTRIEYKNMEVHAKLDEVKSVDEMQFDNCTFSSKDELRKVKPQINMVAQGTDIRNGGYIGNAKIVDTEKSGIEVSVDVIAMNQDMIENKLEPIVEQKEEVRVILADTPCEIKTENTRMEVPADAFLTESGEVYEGEVKVVVKEYMDPIENALTSTPMVNRVNGKNEIFSSSGMLDFRAYDDQGNELQPNPDNIIQVEMNDLQPSESPNFYSFDEEKGNWNEELPPAPSDFARRKGEILDSLNALSIEDVTGYRQIPVFVGLQYKRSRKDPYELSFWTDGGVKMPLRKIKDFQQTVYTSNSDQQWIAHRNTWKIDTTVTDEMKELLAAVKKDVRRVRGSKRQRRRRGNFNGTRVIKDLSMTPDLENDNFVLTFSYRDTIRRIPVVANFGGSIRRIQTKEKAKFKSFQIAQKTALKEKALVEKYERTVLEQYAKIYKARRAGALANYPDYDAANREFLRFGLTSFGLVNCDYFYRNTPDSYLMLDTVGYDNAGREVGIPNDIRNVLIDDNVFVATTAEKVPVYKNKRSVIFFLITSTEIAIIKGWEKLKNGFSRPKIERVPISESDTPDVIRRKILDAKR